MTKKLNTYQVCAVVELEIGITINAESFEDALEKAKKLRETDFVKPLGEYSDGAMEISSVFDEQVRIERNR